MANATILPGDLVANKGEIRHANNFTPPIARAQLAANADQLLELPLSAWRVHDALATNLPGTPTADDLGLVGGTFGSAAPSLQTQDLKTAGASSNYARCLVQLPANYVAGQDVKVRAHAGMLTTIADTSATLDCQVYKSDNEAGVGSDLVGTAAQDINSLTLADIDFTVDGSTLAPGDVLDIRLATAVNDGASGTAVIAIVGATYLVIPTRG